MAQVFRLYPGVMRTPYEMETADDAMHSVHMTSA